ncbi:hypothetical protein [Legionella worsleiensis]|uniref:Transmembrane protein n=1 Tax=Legionella worsleiensis TaxID=45076 RepID=A0A0W1AKJ3_9GAMM|nr:hypothetical protein [Legionella worsleiensis]KTD81884.1 hypothetical protein Lwor_0187 [Legionella worsleiensis]STY31177.1 Uncharacterised protein [Legionella worsleiensis]
MRIFNKPQKKFNANQVLGNTSATTKGLMIQSASPPTPKKNNGIFSKVVVGIIGVVATVMTAGILGALAGASIAGSGGLLALGSAVLAGTATTTFGVTLGGGFAAGFLGNLLSQNVAKAMGLQD